MEESKIKRQKIHDENSESNLLQVESSCDKALRIPLILETILTNLTTDELKQARGVNKYWRKEASSIIIKRDCIRLHFQSNSDDGEYKLAENSRKPRDIRQVQQNNGRKVKVKYLSEFIDLLENSEGQFPCTDYIFTGGDLISGGANKFFSTFGSTVKTLILNCVSPEEETIQQMLSQQIGNIRKLSVSLYFLLTSETSWKLDNLCLPSLSVLYFGKEMHLDSLRRKIAQDIVEHGAKEGKLESVGNFPIQDVTPDFWLEHGRVMKEFNWLPDYTCSDLIDFCAVKPSLKCLSMIKVKPNQLMTTHSWPTVTNHELEQIVKLIKSSQNSLKILHWKSLGNLPKIQFPSIFHLTLHLSSQQEQKFDAALVKYLFPNVKSISLDFERSNWTVGGPSGDEWDKYFTSSPISQDTDSQVQIGSVEELEITKGIPKPWWNNLNVFFPNVKALKSEQALSCVSTVFGLWPNLSKVNCGTSHVFSRWDTEVEWLHQALDIMRHRVNIASQLAEGFVMTEELPDEPMVFTL